MNDCEAGMSGAVIMDDFDVFLNHRGPDVRATFVADLGDALRCAGFRPFLDARSLMKSNPALNSIDQALDMAEVHVAVVSRGYAESKHCLDELVAVMKGGKPVVPVFYDVEPVDLRWVENGPFAEAFERHKVKGRAQKRVQEWRGALRALSGLTGFRLTDYKSNEAQFKQEVVNEVARLTPSNGPVEVEQYRVDLEGPTNSCVQMLDNMGSGPCILGLVGMGGVGKTTLAKEIYNHFAAQKKFRYMTFLEIHRDPSSLNVQVRPTWSRKLRKQLLWDLLSVESSTSNYSSWFKKVSILGPVFIVIDDVHKLGQFEELIPSISLLHLGSKILITSRDQSILKNVIGRSNVVYYLFDVSTLGPKGSNMLFNWYAFHAKEAPKDYNDLAKDVVEACGGLPLALKVIGSSLFHKRSDEDRETVWPEAVDALRQSMDVMGVLKWSYDNLSDSEKLMFVDITCLFYEQCAKEALTYWISCGIKTPHTSLRNLVDKNIIQRSYVGLLGAHDLLRDLGLTIGRKDKSHFVCDSMDDEAFIKNQGTEKTMGLNLKGSLKRKFEATTFACVPNLLFLALPNGSTVNGDLRCISRELRWLQWRNMPSRSVPTGLNLFYLSSLDFAHSTNLASLWTNSNDTLEAYPNLCRLNLMWCRSIKKLPDSLGQLSRLQDLVLLGCKKLKKLPESIGELTALQSIDLNACSSIQALPASIGALSNLQHMGLGAYTSNYDVELPPSIGLLSRLQRLSIDVSTDCQILSDGKIGEAWTRLASLNLRNAGKLGSLLDYGALKSLEWLSLNDRALTELPESIGRLVSLTSLDVLCDRLPYLPKSICELEILTDLTLSGCGSLKRLPKSICELKKLAHLNLTGCGSLKRLPKALGALTSLKCIIIEECPIRKLPKSIGLLSGLRNWRVKGCKHLLKLPTSIRELKSLGRFELMDCGNIVAMGVLTTLKGVPIWGSTSLTEVPASLGLVSTLVVDNGGNEYISYEGTEFLEGESQVLEEDESGFLKAYHNDLTGVTSLLRGCHKKQE